MHFLSLLLILLLQTTFKIALIITAITILKNYHRAQLQSSQVCTNWQVDRWHLMWTK